MSYLIMFMPHNFVINLAFLLLRNKWKLSLVYSIIYCNLYIITYYILNDNKYQVVCYSVRFSEYLPLFINGNLNCSSRNRDLTTFYKYQLITVAILTLFIKTFLVKLCFSLFGQEFESLCFGNIRLSLEWIKVV